jgi:hypothetical protein
LAEKFLLNWLRGKYHDNVKEWYVILQARIKKNEFTVVD